MKWSSMSMRPLAAAVLAVVAGVGGADAQNRAPFRAGELATYQVKLGGASVGQGSLAVLGMVNVRGQQTFHTRMTLNGRVTLARVNDIYESWIDADDLFSHRFHQNVHEIRYRRNRTYDFFPETRTYRRENGSTGTIPTHQPLDDLSFLYYARTLPLDIGASYSLQRYFKADGNPVMIRVLRRETITVPAGRFRTIVVQPVIKTDGLFGEGGRAEVFLSDDEHRIPVLIRSRVPVVGSLTMLLRTFRPGT